MTGKLPVPPNITKNVDALSFFNLLAERSGSIDENNALLIASLSDAEANNGAVYYSTTQDELVYKDDAGDITVLSGVDGGTP